MPELPEVETVRRRIDADVVGRTIVDVIAPDDDIVFPAGASSMTRAIAGRCVDKTFRHGKHLALSFNDGASLYLHLGMTGDVVVAPSSSTEHRFERLRVVFDDGGVLSFVDARRLGRIRFVGASMASPVDDLGPDAFLALPSAATLSNAFARTTRAIKTVLLDQRVLAGVGNWIADEVLFQSRIDPHRRAKDLDEVEVSAIRRALKSVIEHAVNVGADETRFPKSWLFHVRWGKLKGAKTVDGDDVAFSTVGGRTTAWVPARIERGRRGRQ